MGMPFMFLLAVTLLCPVQTKTLVGSEAASTSQDPTSTARPFNVTENVNKDRLICHILLTLLITLVSQDEDVPVTSKNQTVQNEEFKTCGSNHFNCGDERKSCVPLMWRCDGEKDCPNNADEEGCVVKPCSSTEFSCGDERKTCLPMIWRCDGEKDCKNGADEEGCDLPFTSKNQTEMQNEEFKTCGSNQFNCGDERKSCVPLMWRCDGEKDCPNNADEEGCVVKTSSPTVFRCGDKRNTSLPMRWRCDGEKDCPNGADEEGCVTQHEDAPVTSKNQTEMQNKARR
ncbi:low-density lipoprotein receptor-related protein 8-like isoform X1 [Pimephales promelas]|uniref:low-density lipoprotein receptor-related protein 8-like isoform X1 n=1 Tax=Pimephales promelas TaxID=90988 RepID=UPI001955A710|nr:low-density lipoprotein receptor-related protein 8-like isoform X1 [Pimephales promelas]KAG1967197.1 low-density lipoprotein receptor-related protein [Pimephales promelas]